MSGYLLDTNVLSLFFNGRATIAFATWLEAQQKDDAICISMISLQELEKGAEKLSRTKAGSAEKAARLSRWIRDLALEYEHRLLPVDAHVALVAGSMEGEAIARGHNPSLADVLIAATAKAHGLVVVTQNIRDFEALSVPCRLPA
ncbi:type II toxin-antitoxin system VapC family toxin [Rhizobium terrae]|uniref:type II toxin-antitoxin system VapC family toxin n=1 Tax=Rhizobium terrae TaxID=2171756 RepID=UPI000E3C3AC4|nr:type II toxin-antitoxin system VapC family toxin [Rhizobium terrae]